MFSALVLMVDSEAGMVLGELAATSQQVTIVKSPDRVPTTQYEIARLVSIEPDLVFLDLRTPENALDLLQKIRECKAATATVGLCSSLPAGWRERFVEAGVAAFLETPMTQEAFESSIRDAIHKVRAGVSDKLSVFLPSKAGSGATTVALNVAGAFANALGKKTLLIESDLHSGVLSTLLNVSPSLPIVDALARAGDLDYSTWTKFVVQGAGLDALLTDRGKVRPLPSWMNYHQLLRFALGRYDQVVVDLPEVINDATEELVRSAHAVLVTCTPELLSLTLARNRLAELSRRQIPSERVHVVLNRWQRQDMTLADAEDFLKYKVVTALPNDYKSVNNAILGGALIPPDTDLGRGIAALAKWLAGGPLEVPKPKGSSWFGR
jgi:Flp pilus assembly CpaE family ATPase